MDGAASEPLGDAQRPADAVGQDVPLRPSGQVSPRRIASSSSSKISTGATGPNVSSRLSSMPGVTPVDQVGWK